jgi:proline iminopeptidase
MHLVCGCAPAVQPAPTAAASAPTVPAAQLAPGERKLAMSDGTSLFVKVAGHGPVCLFVHGGPGQDTLSFEQMGGSALEAFLTMVYVDQRGSGKSAEATDYHLGRVAEDFDEVRKSLGVDRLCLIAHSFGGVLAVAYARRYPEHVSQLVLANATLQFLGPYQRRMQTAFINDLLQRQVPPLPADADPAALEAANEDAYHALMQVPFGYRLLTENLATVQTMNRLEDYPRAHGFGRAVMERRAEFPEYWADYAPLTAEITTPVLVITSRKDYAVGPDEYKRFRFPHQTVAVLDTGHISYYDASPAFVAAIRGFVTGAGRNG